MKLKHNNNHNAIFTVLTLAATSTGIRSDTLPISVVTMLWSAGRSLAAVEVTNFLDRQRNAMPDAAHHNA